MMGLKFQAQNPVANHNMDCISCNGELYVNNISMFMVNFKCIYFKVKRPLFFQTR